jgi:hypothetical protein
MSTDTLSAAAMAAFQAEIAYAADRVPDGGGHAMPRRDQVERMVAAALAPVYSWLVDELGYPFDMCTAEKPAWLDVTALAAAWAAKDARDHDGRTETVEDWVAVICAEADWAAEGASS